MIRRSKEAVSRADASLKAQFVHDGMVDFAAIRAHAEKQADQLFSGPTSIYASQQAMADGFYAELTGRVQS